MDKIENLISITEVPAGPYIVKGEFKIITKDGKENMCDRGRNRIPHSRLLLQTV